MPRIASGAGKRCRSATFRTAPERVKSARNALVQFPCHLKPIIAVLVAVNDAAGDLPQTPLHLGSTASPSVAAVPVGYPPRYGYTTTPTRSTRGTLNCCRTNAGQPGPEARILRKSRWSLLWPDLDRGLGLNPESRWSLKWPLLKGTSVPTSPESEPRCLLTAGNRQPSRDGLPSPPRSAEGANPTAPTLSPVPASLCSRHCPC
jgi:hypothetical protein